MPSGHAQVRAWAPARWSARGLLALAVAAGVLVVALPLLQAPASASVAASDLLQLAAALIAAFACMHAARRSSGQQRWGWAFLGVGVAAWTVGQAMSTWSELVQGHALALPSPADSWFLLFAPLAMLGLLGLSATVGRSGIAAGALVLDGALATLAVFVVAWPLALEDLFLAQPDRSTALLVVVYPLADLALVGLAGGILLRGRGAWASPVTLLFAGFASIALADLAKTFGVFEGTYATGQVADAGWVVGFLLVGAAAKSRLLMQPVDPEHILAGRAVPVVAVLFGFFGFGIEVADEGLVGPAWRVAMALLVLAALSRQFLVTQEFADVIRQREAAYIGLRRSERTIRVMSKINQAVIRAVDESRLAQRVCELLVIEGGYRVAWLGRSESDGFEVRPLAHAGPSLRSSAMDGAAMGQGPTSRALHDGTTQVHHGIHVDPAMVAWREDALARGYTAACALPMRIGGSRGVLLVCSAEPDAFASDEVNLLEDLAGELAFGLAALQERHLREVAEGARLREAANYQSIVENASDGIFRTSFDGTVLFANQRGAEMLGYDAPPTMLAAKARMAQFYADPADRAPFIDRVTAGDRSPLETRMRRQDGNTFWAALRVALRAGPDGRELVGTMEDISDRKQAEEAREALGRQQAEVKRLEELNKMRMDFLNAAAHDLKTPLTPLKLQMAMLRRGNALDAKARAGLDLMDRNIGRFQVLIEDMLDAARLQAGRLKLRREAAALSPLVREAVASFQESAKQARLDFQLAGLPDVRIDADPMKCMQVLMNLVSNAVKYTPPGGAVRIGIDVHEREAVVRIQDSGIGLAAEQVARLFQPFVRLHEDRPDVAKGTGLGLYISKGIVEQHGGRLWAESPGPEKGATFFVAWPLAGHGPTVKPMAAA